MLDGAFRPHMTAVTENDALHSGKADACSWKLCCTVKPLKGSKQSLRIGGVESRAVVLHKVGLLAIGGAFAKLNASPWMLRRIFPRICQEIIENDPQELAVSFGSNILS